MTVTVCSFPLKYLAKERTVLIDQKVVTSFSKAVSGNGKPASVKRKNKAVRVS
jgi:hypothetical protein